MPIEDYSVAWDETQSVPMHVGRLRIPAQKLDDAFDQEQGEHLTFSLRKIDKGFAPPGLAESCPQSHL